MILDQCLTDVKLLMNERPAVIETMAANECEQNDHSEAIALLCSTNSTTAYFKQICPNGFNVVVHQQEWRSARSEEQELLGLSAPDTVLSREVLLRCNKTVLMAARSIFPKATLHGEGEIFAHLGTRPLGEVLYTDPNLKRDIVRIEKIDPTAKEYHFVTQYLTTPRCDVWGRLSRVYFFGKPLLLYEIFMPALLAVKQGPATAC
jgi:chorismate--pyruvate lyase